MNDVDEHGARYHSNKKIMQFKAGKGKGKGTGKGNGGKGKAASVDMDRNEDLLAWSLALDFDDYAATWGNIATSRA